MVVSLFLLAFTSGALMKLTDDISEGMLNVNRIIGVILGIAYGAVLALTIRMYVIIIPIYLAILISVIATGKIDSYEHGIATALIVINLMLMGIRIKRCMLIPLVMFMISGVMDEIGNDLSDKGKIKGMFSLIFRYRLVLEITTLLYSVISKDYTQWLFLVGLDSGYIVSSFIIKTH